jgi:hypothetical protein
MKTILPLIAWVLLLPFAPEGFVQNQWEAALVMFAALALVPAGLQLLRLPQGGGYWLLALGLCAAYLLHSARLDPFFSVLALPYLGWAMWLTLREATDFLVARPRGLVDWVRVAALAYWATGAAWAVCFLAGIRPLDFDLVIVNLTAAHFHVAGFVLAVAVFCLLQSRATRLRHWMGWGVLAGMPMVATGISLSQLGFAPTFEWVSGLGFVALALAVGYSNAALFSEVNYSKSARWMWASGAACLLAGGALAALYALRFHFPIEWVNIPNMKIWHGTLNALGFGWLTLQGWLRAQALAAK